MIEVIKVMIPGVVALKSEAYIHLCVSCQPARAVQPESSLGVEAEGVARRIPYPFIGSR